MSEAVISDCGQYRYVLTRGLDAPQLPFIMLNPSTADATLDDPTIRRCKGFAEAFGFNGIIVMNLYAYRATKPADLWKADDPIGKENNWWLEDLAHYSKDIVVCAWGANARADRVKEVTDIFKAAGTKLKCLGTTKDGAPRHPLYIKGDQPLIDWEYKHV